MRKKSLSLVIPVYNEANLLTDTINKCLNVLSDYFEKFEIILIDDGSKDDTYNVMLRLQEKNTNIKILQNIVNLNVGISIQRAMKLARHDYVVHNAIDLPLAPEDIVKLIDKMDDCDVLVLQRTSFPGYKIWRIITSLLNRSLLKLLFPVSGKGIYDFNFTQIYRKSILDSILPIAKSPAFTTPEMILRARILKLRVNTVKIDYMPRTLGKGAFGKPHDIFWSLYDMLRFRIKLWF